jgi:PST family polysaccharide transporter
MRCRSAFISGGDSGVAFFNSVEFEPVLRALVWLFPIRALATVGEALAQREMRFRWLAVRDTLAFGAGYFGVGVGFALLGFGVWALVAANLGAAVLKTTMILRAYPPPGLRTSRNAFRELFYFGGGHTLARLSNYLALQGDNLVVARFLDLFSLGIYGRAYQLMSVPATVFGQILDRVLFPSLAKLQNQTKRLADAYLHGVRLIALVMLPVSIVGILLAPEIVNVLLGKAWTEVTLPFRILVVGLLMRTSYKLSDSLARATGAVYRRAWRQAIYAAAVIGGAWVGHFRGVAGVAAGVLAAVAVNFFLMAGLSLKIAGLSRRDFFEAHIPALKVAFCTALIALPSVLFLRKIDCPSFLILAAVGVSLTAWAALALRFAPRFFLGEQSRELEKLLRKLLPAKDGRKPSLEAAKSVG